MMGCSLGSIGIRGTPPPRGSLPPPTVSARQSDALPNWETIGLQAVHDLDRDRACAHGKGKRHERGISSAHVASHRAGSRHRTTGVTEVGIHLLRISSSTPRGP